MKKQYKKPSTVVELCFYLTVVIMASAILSACQKAGEETETAEAPADHSRQVDLYGQSNFRDIGGYKTPDGRVVKWGQVYRSGELHKLSDDDVAVLEKLGIRTVASFLTGDEVAARGGDRLPVGVREIALPIESGAVGELVQVAGEARKTGDFSKLPPDVNQEIHRALVNEAREQYGTLLKEIADPANRPFVFHCSHGIHRTGTAAAILLSILGVPWDTIEEDYLLSNEYRADEIEKRLDELRQAASQTLGIRPSEVDMTNMRAFYVLEAAYIDAAYDDIVGEYGSMENYVRNELGLTEDDIRRLRRDLLD